MSSPARPAPSLEFKSREPQDIPCSGFKSKSRCLSRDVFQHSCSQELLALPGVSLPEDKEPFVPPARSEPAGIETLGTLGTELPQLICLSTAISGNSCFPENRIRGINHRAGLEKVGRKRGCGGRNGFGVSGRWV